MSPSAMATSFSISASLTRSPPTPPLLFNPNLLSFLRPLSIPTLTLTLTNAKKKTKPIESTSTLSIEEEEDEDDDDDEEEEFLAFEDMRRWEMKKPAGFGEGKVYDTTVEEKLLEEMERERERERERIAAEVAAEAKKAKGSSSKKQELAQKDAINGPAVRLGNLPKKKNIDRDLRAAFKGFKGIVKISPAVAGNWKTRDPVCKGFAFVEFVSEEAAVR